MKHLVLLLCCLVASTSLWAQGKVSGKVNGAAELPENPSRPLTGAMVFVQKEHSAQVVIGGYTKEDGKFEFNLEEGEYVLIASSVGFGYDTTTFQIKNGEVSHLDILLERSEKKVVDFFSSYNTTVQTITAFRSSLPGTQSPEAISTLNRQQILQNNPRSMPEALMGTAGVWVQKTNHGGGSPFVRGLTGNQTLLLVDGIRLNNAGYRYGPNQYLNSVDPFSVERVEVLRGSGSVQFGSDALGGTINMISRSPEFSTDGNIRVKLGGNIKFGTAFWEGSRFDQERSTRAEIQLQGKQVATLVGLSVKDFGELVAGQGLGPEPPSAYQEIDIDFKAIFKSGTNNQLILGYQRVNQDSVGRFDQVTQLGKYELYQFDPQRRTLGYMKWEHKSNASWSRKLSATFSFQEFIEERDKRRTGASMTTFERDEIRTGGFSLVNEGFLGTWNHSSGLDIYYDQVNSEKRSRVDSTGEETISRGLYPDASSMLNAGLFSLHTYEFPNKLRVNGGLRYNLINVYAFDETFGDLNISPQTLVGNLGLMIPVKEGHKLTALLNTGFRAPNVNDMTSFGSFDFGIEVPNTQLNPERTVTGELGYKAFSNRGNFSAQFSGFYTRLFNLITRTKSSFEGDTLYNGQRVFVKTNEDQAFIAGLEGDLHWRPSGRSPWTVDANLTYLYGQTLGDNPSPLRRIPPLNGRIRFTYQQNKLQLAAEWMGATLQDRLAGGDIDDHRIPDGGTPAWSLINAYASYYISWAIITFKAENLLNEAYRYHGSGVDGYGRSFWISFRFDML